MTIKHVKQIAWTVEQANQQVKQEYDERYWQFLVRLLNIRELNWNDSARSIEFADFIPLKMLLNEVLERISTGEVMLEKCHVCQHYYDANLDDGIFGHPEELAHFICKQCANSLTAWEFYQHHLKI